jgi:hypothetical protein
MIDATNPSSTETATINPTGITFQSSGSATDSLNIYNDSADGGEIEWSNTSGTNGLTITSNQDLDLISTKAGGFINMTSTSSIDITATGDNLVLTAGAILQLDSGDIRLENATTVVATPNNQGYLAMTSFAGDITNYLQVKINGADAWIPYWPSNPAI